MVNDLVSIMVPCYNGAKYLNKFLNSILMQTYKNLELIITNDGSTDNSCEIIESYIDKFKSNNMTLTLISQENKGQASAINNCLKHINGQFLMWADCDDYYEFDAVENLVSYLKIHKEFQLVRGKARIIDYDTNTVLSIAKPKYLYSKNVFDEYMFETDTYCLPGVNITYTDFFDKCIKNRHIYDETKGGQNWQLILPLMYYGNVGYLDLVVYNYNYILNSHSHSFNSNFKLFKRYDTLKDILFHVIDSIDIMENVEKNKYKKKVKNKYLYLKLKLIKCILLHKSSYNSVIYDSKYVCNPNECTGCGACSNSCKKNAIKMIMDNKGFLYPQVDKEKCINCNICKNVCPVLNNHSEEKKIDCFACYNIDEDERNNSSSGGIFILLAKEIINNNGVVFGASFDDTFHLKHTYTESIEGLKAFITSKYIQSEIGNSYTKVKSFLDNGRKVLFSGTPCQIEGLLKFLNKQYDGLITLDIICHGVPSPKVWHKYLEGRNMNYKPQKVNFRSKVSGWNRFSIHLKYPNGEYSNYFDSDTYMNAFLQNYSIRESCFNCSFKKKYRNSDITLGDYWGIENVIGEFDDNKGVSAVIINSNKGMKLFSCINNNLKCRESNIEKVINYNSAFTKSVCKPTGYDYFFEVLNISKSFDDILSKVKKRNKRISLIFKKIIRKVLNV